MKQRKQETQRLIDENDQLRKQLNVESRHYYEDLIVYMRAHTLFRDDHIVEENLMAILQDLIDAQQNGMDAETYFGKDPAKTGAEMLKVIPRNIVDFAWFNLKLMMMLVLLTLLPNLTTPEVKLDSGNLLLVNITILIATWSILWIVGSNAFGTPSRAQKVGFFIGGGAIFAGTVGLLFFFKTSWQLTISPQISFILIVSGLIVGALLPFFSRPTGIKLFLYFYSMGYLLLGLLVHLPFTRKIMTAKNHLGAYQWLLWVGLAIFAILIGLVSWWFIRRERRHDPDR